MSSNAKTTSPLPGGDIPSKSAELLRTDCISVMVECESLEGLPEIGYLMSAAAHNVEILRTPIPHYRL